MEVINPPVITPNPKPAQTPLDFIFWWGLFRSIKVTIACLTVLVIVTSLVSIIPQSALINNGLLGLLSGVKRELFLPSSPQYLLNTPLFWLPVGILTLNSLIALADISQYTWQRWHEILPDIQWQHPYTSRVEIISDSTNLETLPPIIQQQNFIIQAPATPTEPKIYTTSQNRWAWWGIVSFYVGCLSLSLALLGSHYLAQSDHLQLLPETSQPSPLTQANFKLIKVDDSGQTAQFEYTPQDGSPQELTWSRYQPKWFNNSIAILTQFQPMLQVSARNNKGEAIRLMPIQEDLSPNELIYLPINGDPIYFRLPANNLNFQVIPESDNRYNVQIQRQSEITPSINITVNLDEPLTVDTLKVTFHLTYQTRILLYRNYALPLYLLAVIFWGFGLISYFIRQPIHVWFIQESPNTLYSVAEGFHSPQTLTQILQTMLNKLPSTDIQP